MNSAHLVRWCLAPILAVSIGLAATPPDLVNFQGVLRDESGKPLTGTFDMVFRFYGSPASGTEILADTHAAPEGVAVMGGLFAVALGSGAISGHLNSLSEVFASSDQVYLQIEVSTTGRGTANGHEILMPRIQLHSEPYALNAHRLEGKASAEFLDTSALPQSKSGALGVGSQLAPSHMLTVKSADASTLGLLGPLGAWGAGARLSFGDSDYVYIEESTDDNMTIHAQDGVTMTGDLHVIGSFDAIEAEGGFTGIRAYGSDTGGHFEDTDSTGYAQVGHGDHGIRGFGSLAGGYFEDSDSTGYASVGDFNFGIRAYGSLAGGCFQDTDNGESNPVCVAQDTYKIVGPGSVAFVQNHPEDDALVIVYNCLEGDEVATYTRGTARMHGGEARVPLGETFRWVTNPDVGLTAQLTPRGSWTDLYVDSLTTDELVVRAREKTVSEAEFDYVVFGLRIGFEEVSIVQDKMWEARIPSMHGHALRYEQQPELRRHNALERFKRMRGTRGYAEDVELAASLELKDRIGRTDQAAHKSVDRDSGTEVHDNRSTSSIGFRADELGDKHILQPSVRPVGQDAVLQEPSRQVLSKTCGSSELVAVSGPVEPGDVLIASIEAQGTFRRSSTAHDRAVVGIASGEPAVLSPTGLVPLISTAPELAESLERLRTERNVEDETRIWLRLESQFEQIHTPIAVSGITACKVDAGFGAIRVGDLLTTSPTPGHAMFSNVATPGTIIGKALEPLDGGSGVIKVLVIPR